MAAAEPAERAAQVAAPKPKRGLGSLGKQSLERPEIVPSLVLIPAHRALSAPALLPSPSRLAKTIGAAASAQAHEQNDSTLVRYMRDELHSLLALLDEAPKSL